MYLYKSILYFSIAKVATYFLRLILSLNWDPCFSVHVFLHNNCLNCTRNKIYFLRSMFGLYMHLRKSITFNLLAQVTRNILNLHFIIFVYECAKHELLHLHYTRILYHKNRKEWLMMHIQVSFLIKNILLVIATITASRTN